MPYNEQWFFGGIKGLTMAETKVEETEEDEEDKFSKDKQMLGTGNSPNWESNISLITDWWQVFISA